MNIVNDIKEFGEDLPEIVDFDISNEIRLQFLYPYEL